MMMHRYMHLRPDSRWNDNYGMRPGLSFTTHGNPITGPGPADLIRRIHERQHR